MRCSRVGPQGRLHDFFQGVIGGGQGVRGRSPPEAESILVIGCPTEPANLAPFQKCICISTLGATVMIREKIYVEIQGGHVTPLPLPGSAHEDEQKEKEMQGQNRKRGEMRGEERETKKEWESGRK